MVDDDMGLPELVDELEDDPMLKLGELRDVLKTGSDIFLSLRVISSGKRFLGMSRIGTDMFLFFSMMLLFR